MVCSFKAAGIKRLFDGSICCFCHSHMCLLIPPNGTVSFVFGRVRMTEGSLLEFYVLLTVNNILSQAGAGAVPFTVLPPKESSITFTNSVPDGVAIPTVGTSHVHTLAFGIGSTFESDDAGLFLLHDIWKFVAFETTTRATRAPGVTLTTRTSGVTPTLVGITILLL